MPVANIYRTSAFGPAIPPRLVSGGAALFANGTGTASFDSFRVTTFPDPSAPLSNVGRAVNSVCNWNASVPNNTNLAVYTSIDNGITYQPHANAGDYIPTISTAAYYAAVRANGPLAFYRLNEKTGNVAYDSSNNGHDGTINPLGVTQGQPGMLQGLNESTDTAMLFDGTSGYIKLPTAGLPTGAAAWTLEAWCQIPSVPISGFNAVLAMGNRGSLQLGGLFVVVSGGQAYPYLGVFGGVGVNDIQSSTPMSLNTTTHLVATYDGTNTRLYQNGALVAGPHAVTLNLVQLFASIGSDGTSPVEFFPGTIQNCAIYGAALSASAITANYNAGIQATQAVYNDSFTANTSTGYTSTFGNGAVAATSWTWDTVNSHVTAVGGTRALLLYNTFKALDLDMIIDLLQAQNAGMVWRYIDANNYYELLVKDSANGNTFTLNKMASGILTTLSTASISFTTNTHHRCRVTMLSGVITAWLDESQILTYTDGSPLASGQWGLRNDTGTSYFYLLQMTPQASNISATALVSKHVLTSTDPTATPQITDHQAFASNQSIGIGAYVDSADYRQQHVVDNVNDLNTKSNYWWSIGSDKNIVFQARNAKNSPYILQSTDILIGSMPTVEYSGDLYRNKQILKGVYDTSTFNESRIGDNSTRTWGLSNPVVAPPKITLNGAPVSVGLQGKDTNRQYYYTLNQASITQDNSQAILKATDTLAISYTGSFGIDFELNNTGQVLNTISQAQLAAKDGTTGIMEQVEDVSSQAMNLAAATAYANSLLQRYGSIARTIKFETLHSGLQAGHSLPVFVPQLNIFDSVFLVVEVGIRARTINVNGVGQIQFVFSVVCSEAAALSSWAKLFNKIMRSVSGTKPKA